MPYNGAGVYSAPSLPGSFNPPITGQEATGADWSTILADFVAAFSNVICLDGQTTITANIPFNGKKITGLGAATLTGDAVNAGQIVGNALTGIADTGAADAYVIAPTIPITAYVAYQRFQFVSAHANTGATTVAVSSLAAKSIKRPNGDALSANDILSGAIVDIQYDGTNFILLDGGNSAISYSLLTTRGDTIKRGASAPARLAIGTANQVYITDGTDPLWGQVSLTAGVTGVLPRTNGGFTPSDITNSLSGDVAMNSTASYFDGPSIAQGTSGTWLVSGSVVVDYQNGNSVVDAKLWDGTTVIASTQQQGSSNTPTRMNIALSGRISSPAANLRISVRNETVATGSILFNASGNSKDSTITAIRIA